MLLIGMGRQEVKELREVGKLLAYLKSLSRRVLRTRLISYVFKQVLIYPAKRLHPLGVPTSRVAGIESTLDKIPVMSCWADDVAPLLAKGLAGFTRGPNKKRQNLEIYLPSNRKIGKNKIIMRWIWLTVVVPRWIYVTGLNRTQVSRFQYLLRFGADLQRFLAR